MRKLTLMLILALSACATVGARRSMAIAQFQAVFLKQYINDHEDKEFAKFVKTKVRCHICHKGKVTPKNVHHNVYGKPLVELLDPHEDKKDVDKIKAAIEKVGKMHSDPKDDKSPTFAELIAKGELPGGDLEEAKKEPTEEEKAPE